MGVFIDDGTPRMTETVLAQQLWHQGGWQSHCRIELDGAGRIAAIHANDTACAAANAWVLPGITNLHSHAFQRAMAGLAERRGHSDDSFWSWREVMYAFAERIQPDDLRDIAAQLYVEMLKAGYTRVCEFHYLHQQADGTPYADPAAMSLALIEAAREAGIGLTLLPVLYQTGGFDGRALSPRQRRFGLDTDAYLGVLERLNGMRDGQLDVGIALHSLRAVPAAAMAAVLASPLAQQCPIHIHIAEQLGEVQDCLALRNARPVEWLLDHAAIDRRWCLVHATHLSADECRRAAATGAVAGLCPSTEGNLGDGLFPLRDWMDAGGALGVGSDSHISISPVEELRWLEYGQRLISGKRNVAAAAGHSVGETLWQAALDGGARAAGQAAPLSAGSSADLSVLDAASPLLAARDNTSVLDSFLFSGNTPLVRDVMAGGRWQVRDFHHRDEERIAARFRRTVNALRQNPR
ncbi:MAG TPA: formimidoylglutamate deiminase [Rhodanobacteraceae bacterium]|nr:formimidoylglutamate deiminase [Rhodanobacteraceae bacterium]